MLSRYFFKKNWINYDLGIFSNYETIDQTIYEAKLDPRKLKQSIKKFYSQNHENIKN